MRAKVLNWILIVLSILVAWGLTVQVFHTYEIKSVKDIACADVLFRLVASFFWAIKHITMKDKWVIAANVITLVPLLLYAVIFTIYYLSG